ncbi:MAG: PorV/PorQ family protein [Saprospiraceae bacterium]|nr:PorV/PorQ family protein [Saprospiraceae bacterium]
MKNFYAFVLTILSVGILSAGNPDRQGEAGAAQLLMVPWARMAGLHALNTSSISGVEAMRLNVAGLSRIHRTEINIAHTRYLDGAGINFNAFGLAQKVGANGALGLSLMSIDFGDINVTTDAFPEGTGATFSPSYFNIGLGYSHLFANKVSVGMLVRGVSEGLSNLNAFGVALDAGVQYVTGERDNFKLGISLRNIGGPLKFDGEGVTLEVPNPNDNGTTIRVRNRVSQFELPSTLNIGLSYDFYIGQRNRITALGNFTSNSFSRDNLGGGLELSIREMFMVRGAYRYEIGASNATAVDAPLYTGLAAGASLVLPISKEHKNRTFAIDYGYRVTKIYQGSHNIGVRFNL